MRKLIIATTALAFLSSTAVLPSTAFAQDKGGTTAQSDTMSKGEMSKTKKKKKTKKSSMMKKEDTTK